MASRKRGVGKSTFSVNLAITLGKLGHKVFSFGDKIRQNSLRNLLFPLKFLIIAMLQSVKLMGSGFCLKVLSMKSHCWLLHRNGLTQLSSMGPIIVMPLFFSGNHPSSFIMKKYRYKEPVQYSRLRNPRNKNPIWLIP